MAEYRRGAHTVFEIHLHIVFTTKYRKPALSGEVATRVQDLIREICAQHEVKIMKGHVAKGHVQIVAEYIANQNENQDEDFRVDG